AAARRRARHVGLPRHRGDVLRRDDPRLHRLPIRESRSVLSRVAAPERAHPRHQHPRPAPPQLYPRPRRPRGARRRAPAAARCARRDDRPRLRLPRLQGGRVVAPLPRGARAGDPLHVRRPRARRRRALLLALLRAHRRPRRPLDDRDRRDDRDRAPRVARAVLARVSQPGRDRRPLLALRRHRVDLPAADSLSGREAHAVSVAAPRVAGPGLYALVLAALLFLTALTILVSYVDLGPFSTPIAFLIAA